MVAITTHIGDHPGAQRVDHRAPHPVQAAGHLVTAGTELAAGVQDRQHQRQRRDTFGRVDGHRDTAAVVDDPAAAAVDQFDLDVVAVAGQRLVHRVVDDLIDQMVQAALTGRADVHARTLANRLQPLEYLDLRRPVLALGVQVGSRVLEVDVLIGLASAFGGVVHRIIGSVRLARPHCQITHRQQLLRRSEPPGRRWALAPWVVSRPVPSAKSYHCGARQPSRCPLGGRGMPLPRRSRPIQRVRRRPSWSPTGAPVHRGRTGSPRVDEPSPRTIQTHRPTPPRGRTVPTDHPDPQTTPAAG